MARRSGGTRVRRARTALVVGAGAMGRRWADVVARRDDLVLAAWVDTTRDVVEAAAADLSATGNLQAGDVLVEDDLERALDAVSPDLVVDVTVPEAHLPVTLACLERRIPVLGEKPMTTTVDEARRLVEASERTGTLFAVSQSRRYNAELFALRRLVEEHLGHPEIVSCWFYRAPHFGGFRDAMPSPLLLDMAIHAFDVARWLVGSDPVAVYCDEHNPSWSWYRGAASATAVFEMSGGERFSYAGSWCAPGEETSWEGLWRVTSGAGTASWDGGSAPTAEVETGTGTTRRTGEVDRSVPQGIEGALDEFVAALDGGPAPMGECHENLKSLAMTLAAVESAATRRRIAVRWT